MATSLFRQFPKKKYKRSNAKINCICIWRIPAFFLHFVPGDPDKMKSLLYLHIVLLFVISTQGTALAQDPYYKQYTGQYGSNSGICLFDDGRFMLYGYATAIFGSYSFENGDLLFHPDKPARFDVFAHHNKSIGDSCRINFTGFDNGETFIRFGNDHIYRVFNEDANCFDAPFVYEMPGIPANFTFYHSSEQYDEPGKNGKPVHLWKYSNDKGYNDFFLVYNPPREEYENFKATLSETGSSKVLKISVNGREESFRKPKTDEEENSQWDEILEWRSQYDRTHKDTILANRHYKTFIPDLTHYNYNASFNLYTGKDAAANEAYFRNDPYNDDRYLRIYVKLQPQRRERLSLSKDEITASAIFYTVCGEGSERSYHYNGYREYEEEKNNNPD